MSESEISAQEMAEEPAATPADLAGNRLFVLVLQHPQESREPLATAATLVAGLRRARLVAGLSWPNLARALGRPADPRRWGVLYLGSARPGPPNRGAEVSAGARPKPAGPGPRQEGAIIVLGRDGEPVGNAEPILRGLDGIVLLDGSWREAKTLWWRNPWLLKLHRLVLNPPRPARLGRVRREPRREALSTIEAAAMVLRHVERTPAAAEALTAALDRLLAGVKRRPG